MGKIKTDELEERVGSAGITVNSTVKIDTITEKTSGSGVTIDGLLIKDGGGTNRVLVKSGSLGTVGGGTQYLGNKSFEDDLWTIEQVEADAESKPIEF